MSSTKVLEIACFNLKSALIAESAGADRIELCGNYKEGGLTPSMEVILEARKKIRIPIHVIIRPHANNFIYSVNEIEMMKESIGFCKTNNINGIVFGILNKEREINVPVCKTLTEFAKPLSVNFHRAIDHCADLNHSIEKLIDIGVDRVLTSGGEVNAENGIDQLKELQNRYGDKIIIMPGGSLRATNVKMILSSGCSEYHSSAITGLSEVTNADEIKRLKMILNNTA